MRKLAAARRLAMSSKKAALKLSLVIPAHTTLVFTCVRDLVEELLEELGILC
jgi:hypothetical protein